MSRVLSSAGLAGLAALALFGCPTDTQADGKGGSAAKTDSAKGDSVKPKAAAQAKDITDQDYPMPALPIARLTLTDAYGGTHPIEAEVAADNPSRTRGLMWRTELKEGKGMIFLFPHQQPLSFWMRNTLIPLDMVFIEEGWTIAGVVENAEPRTTSSRGVGRPSKYVLELPGGYAAKIGLKAGLKVKAEGLEHLEVTE